MSMFRNLLHNEEKWMEDASERFDIPLENIVTAYNDYYFFDYLQSDGNQYINTAYTTKLTTIQKWRIIASFQAPFSYMGANGNMVLSGSSNITIPGASGKITYVQDKVYDLLLSTDASSYRYLTYNGTTYKGSKATQKTALYLFSLGGTTTSYNMSARIYASIIDGENFMIPARDKRNTVFGMLDLKGNRFYRGVTTSAFQRGDYLSLKDKLASL